MATAPSSPASPVTAAAESVAVAVARVLADPAADRRTLRSLCTPEFADELASTTVPSVTSRALSIDVAATQVRPSSTSITTVVVWIIRREDSRPDGDPQPVTVTVLRREDGYRAAGVRP